MDRTSVDWRGNFCAVVTPFTRGGELDEQSFVRNLEMLIDEGIDGLMVAGHTGESWALTADERFRCFRLAAAAAAGRVPVIGGASAIRPDEAVEFAQGAEAHGLDGILLTAPAYAMVNGAEILAHFRAVSDACALPIMLYNIPRRVGRELTPELLAQAAAINRVVAVKQSGPAFDDITRVIDRCGDRLLVFAGNSAERGLPAVAVGADGFVSSVETQALGGEAIGLWRLAVAGDTILARAIQARCAEVKRTLGSYGTEPAALKAAMNHVGRAGGYPRPPILPLSPEQAADVMAFMDRLTPVVA